MDDIKKNVIKLNEGLKETKYEVELLTRSIDQKRTEFTEIVTKQIEELDAQIKSLEKETVILLTHQLNTRLMQRIAHPLPEIIS